MSTVRFIPGAVTELGNLTKTKLSEVVNVVSLMLSCRSRSTAFLKLKFADAALKLKL